MIAVLNGGCRNHLSFEDGGLDRLLHLHHRSLDRGRPGGGSRVTPCAHGDRLHPTHSRHSGRRVDGRRADSDPLPQAAVRPFGDVVAERHRYLSMPLVFIGHACLITCCRTCSTGITSLGCAASSWRSGIGGDSTHWCTGTWGMTWPTRLAAAFVIRRTPHDGRIPRRLQLKAAR